MNSTPIRKTSRFCRPNPWFWGLFGCRGPCRCCMRTRGWSRLREGGWGDRGRRRCIRRGWGCLGRWSWNWAYWRMGCWLKVERCRGIRGEGCWGRGRGCLGRWGRWNWGLDAWRPGGPRQYRVVGAGEMRRRLRWRSHRSKEVLEAWFEGLGKSECQMEHKKCIDVWKSDRLKIYVKWHIEKSSNKFNNSLCAHCGVRDSRHLNIIFVASIGRDALSGCRKQAFVAPLASCLAPTWYHFRRSGVVVLSKSVLAMLGWLGWFARK